MVRSMHERDILREPNFRCTQCNARMFWACIETTDDGSEVRTYECKSCCEIQQYKTDAYHLKDVV